MQKIWPVSPEIVTSGNDIPNESLNMILKRFNELTAKKDDNQNQIKSEFQLLRNDVTAINKKLDDVETKISETDKKVADIEKRIDIQIKDQAISNSTQEASFNRLEQLNLNSKLTILNLPADLQLQQIITGIATWSGMDWSNSVKRTSINRSPHFKSIYLEFWSPFHRNKFMDFIKSKQRDQNGQYIGIVNEHIFELNANHPARGEEINMRQEFTTINKEIFNEARKYRATFKHVWLGDQGDVLVRLSEQGKAIDHLLSDLHLSNSELLHNLYTFKLMADHQSMLLNVVTNSKPQNAKRVRSVEIVDHKGITTSKALHNLAATNFGSYIQDIQSIVTKHTKIMKIQEHKPRVFPSRVTHWEYARIQYKHYRNKISNLIKSEKKRFVDAYFQENSTDSRKVWHQMKQLLYNKSDELVMTFHYFWDQVEHTFQFDLITPQEISNVVETLEVRKASKKRNFIMNCQFTWLK